MLQGGVGHHNQAPGQHETMGQRIQEHLPGHHRHQVLFMLQFLMFSNHIGALESTLPLESTMATASRCTCVPSFSLSAAMRSPEK